MPGKVCQRISSSHHSDPSCSAFMHGAFTLLVMLGNYNQDTLEGWPAEQRLPTDGLSGRREKLEDVAASKFYGLLSASSLPGLRHHLHATYASIGTPTT